ncbi:eukaryotic translation initiation factor 3 subunit [Grosmannia clavigera kw1407]|uniref:Eukaryotic translation initiation factor 3 subunit D n=1 Tax=Grosmannia clavigera (strain kw1407 / UAMH 11150) TaxID=655863 RepID=F0XE16_GROCL|nr:eukaryotic translation initiation factor 3 subunit [Grosmannia clavigera kw1407]EFX03638.1 eukaryotic translation initiation factor 3 subunit [Grosmannia clavigera kw1407]
MASSSSTSGPSGEMYSGGGSGFITGLTEKKVTRDGQPAKRRGPKPDSRPALTRRQELNRQAQRTHRERKELYIKALEDEVLRLKEIYTNVAQDKERLAEENRQLRQMLSQGGSTTADDATSNPTSGGLSVSASGSYVQAPSSNTSAFTPPPVSVSPHLGGSFQQQQQGRNPGIDYEQAGIDFVLTDVALVLTGDPLPLFGLSPKENSLEKPCMAHIPFLLERSVEMDGTPCGHALMASCPPETPANMTPDIPFGSSNVPVDVGDAASGQRTWDLSKGDLATLLHLSSKLNLDGEITPVMAWGMILAHPRLGELTPADFQKVTEEMSDRVRCYGFGAVMEDFEARDAIENLFSTKPDLYSPVSNPGFAMAFTMTDSLANIISALPDGDGWGPPVTTETTLNGVPYAPFSKGDKLGRMADWTVDSKDGRDGRGGRSQYNRYGREQQVYGAGSVALFAAPLAEDEASFSVVSNARDTVKTRYGRGAVFTRGGRGQQRGGRGDSRGGSGPRGGMQQRGGAGGRQGGQYGGGQGGGYNDRGGQRGGGGGARGRRFGWKDYDKPARIRDASINIRADWKLLEEIDFNRLGKLNLDADAGEDLDSCGFLYYYDRAYDKPAVAAVGAGKAGERRLTALDRAAYNVTTSSDPVIQELAERGEATIYATDSVLSMLMCAPRSVYSWDIVIVRQGNKIFLDKRDSAALDMVTVNENAVDSPMDAADGSKDTVNQPGALAEEATYINHNFATQVVLEGGAKVRMAHANPFYNAAEETEPPASKAYKYRRFDLSTNDEDPVYLVVRTELDAVQKNATTGEDQFLSIKALNEFDSKAQGSGGALDWRTKLVSQRGAVVATEMKNNSCKLARWTVQSILAQADIMKIGFVSRANPKVNDKHVILGVVGWKPRDFASQMNLSLSNGWGIVRTIADMCLKKEDGRYVLVKDPNKPILRLYQVPAGSFEDDAEEDVVEPPVEEE